MKDYPLKKRLLVALRIIFKRQPVPKITHFSFASDARLTKVPADGEFRHFQSHFVFDYAGDWFLEHTKIWCKEKLEKESFLSGEISNVKIKTVERLKAKWLN